MSKQFNFKFDIGDTVFTLKSGSRTLFTECLSCDEGLVKLKNGKTLKCPVCEGKGLLADRRECIFIPTKTPMTIGQQEVEICPSVNKIKESYMCKETGIGSGTSYRAEDLFTTFKEAHDEADKRNKDTTEWVCKKCNPNKGIKDQCYYDNSEWLDCAVHGNTSHVMQSVLDKQ